MKKNEWLKWQRSHRNKTMPVLTFPAIKALNTSVRSIVQDSTKQADLMEFIANKYPTSVAIGFMDLSVEAEAFGSEVRFFDFDVPTIIGSIIKTDEDAKTLIVPDPFTGRTNTYIQGIKKAKERISDKPVFAGVIGPFSLAGRLMDMTEIMINCYINPEIVVMTLQKTTDFIINYINAFKSVGADGVLMAEPAAGLLSPELCQKFSSKYIKQIKEAVSDDSFVFGYHNCGNVLAVAKEIIEIDADIYHFGDAIDIKKMLDIMPEKCLIMGNINPSKFIKDSLKKEIYNDTYELLKECNKHSNFVISTGCDIPCSAPLENVQSYFDAVTDFYKND
ncbi:MAG: uroporphyrinogen decarboxylase family protein [Tenericutes bacterium]|nr:uroporphyrinogen decarboxylase family protein [Mycoplasmatota bacterium]